MKTTKQTIITIDAFHHKLSTEQLTMLYDIECLFIKKSKAHKGYFKVFDAALKRFLNNEEILYELNGGY